jgi:hypothetical protein
MMKYPKCPVDGKACKNKEECRHADFIAFCI